MAQGTMIGKYAKFLRVAPFLGFPVLMFFPAGMSLYWVIVSGMHLLVTLSTNSRTFKRITGTEDYLPGTILYREYLKNRELEDKGNLYVQRPTRQSLSASSGDNVHHTDHSSKHTLMRDEKITVEKREEIQVDGGIITKAKGVDGKKVTLFTTKPKKPQQ